MREGGKKNNKKTIQHIFGKVNEGDQIKKNIGKISGKVFEGEQIKKNDLFQMKVMRATKRQPSKKKT